MNEFMFNPAAAGNDGLTTFNLTARKEWLGFSNEISTPESYSFSAQTRILKRKVAVKSNLLGKYIDRSDGRMGLGINIFNDVNGIFNQTGLGLSYAYHVQMKDFQMSLGLAFSIYQLHLKSKLLDFKDNDHERFANTSNNTSWIPDFNAGLHILNRKYKFGFACTQLMQSKFVVDDMGMDANRMNIVYRRNYYLTASYKNFLPSSRFWEFEPSFMLRMYDLLEFSPEMVTPKYQADFMLRMIYQKSYWAGLAYRTNVEYIFLLGFKYNKLFFTYSFDYGNNGISQFSYGSHELSLSVKFGDSTRRYRWIERY